MSGITYGQRLPVCPSGTFPMGETDGMSETGGMERHVRAWMRAEVAEGTDLALLVAVSDAPVVEESLSVVAGGSPHPVTETRDRYGSRLHLVHGLPTGTVEIVYE